MLRNGGAFSFFLRTDGEARLAVTLLQAVVDGRDVTSSFYLCNGLLHLLCVDRFALVRGKGVGDLALQRWIWSIDFDELRKLGRTSCALTLVLSDRRPTPHRLLPANLRRSVDFFSVRALFALGDDLRAFEKVRRGKLCQICTDKYIGVLHGPQLICKRP